MAGASQQLSVISDQRPQAGAARLSLTWVQALVWTSLTTGFGIGLILAPDTTFQMVASVAHWVFLASAAVKLATIPLSRRRVVARHIPTEWPRYTVMVALYQEAEVLPQLVERLGRLDYPEDRLEGFLLLEAHDEATIGAAEQTVMPAWLRVVVVPPGSPKTKPRALNHGLTLATGDIVTIYDAEDAPDPQQLREAAMRFAADEGGRFACLQAPLRIRRLGRAKRPTPMFDTQFAVEYAALFEVALPALAALSLPFPLGGTSNHFRAEALHAVGGWDAFNVTEDADLGFRLWRSGWRSGVLEKPTHETPPGGMETWLPQRTRWLKGHMQTWGVHTRDLRGLGWRGMFALVITTGTALVAALIHAPIVAWVVSCLLIAAVAGIPPATPPFAMSVLTVATGAAWAQAMVGARRAGVPFRAWDMLFTPVYWSVMNLAFFHAVWRLIREPHAWDKTAHHKDEPAEVVVVDFGGETYGPVPMPMPARVRAGRRAA